MKGSLPSSSIARARAMTVNRMVEQRCQDFYGGREME
jgi:hypothetical protein